MGVLVDTSVWVAHFRQRNSALTELLELDMVLTHPMVLGELACGTPPARAQTLADIESLKQTQQATLREVLDFIDQEKLHGLGCGLVDVILLASTLMTPGTAIWTLDKRLSALSDRFRVLHRSIQR